MSSDFTINKSDLKAAGVVFSELKDEEWGISASAKFPKYTYLREVTLDGEAVRLCCGGRFRAWLTNFLVDEDITFCVN